MYIKVIKKEENTYFILCVASSKKGLNVWVEHFISRNEYVKLLEVFPNMKVVEK